MEFAMGVLGWSAEQFWSSTMVELMWANSGHVTANKVPSVADEAPNREEYLAFKAGLGEN